MRLISTSRLEPNMVLAKSIYDNGCLILCSGQTNLGRYVESLHNMGIEYLYVEDEKSEGIEIPDVISEETRIKCKTVLRDVMVRMSNESVMDVDIMQDMVDVVLEEVLQNRSVQVGLNDIGTTDDYTLTHSVSTTVYALLLASRLNYSKNMLKKLAIGALLHDIGKVLLDKDILFKEGALDEDEIEYVKQHTTLGYMTLKESVTLSELSRIIALQHHERMDGSGYPSGVKASEVHEFSRIVAIADVYDALTTDRCYHKKWPNDKAVSYLIKCAGDKFDTELVRTFVQLVAIYPNGSIVRLSNGCYAIVKEQNKNMPLRPIVRVYEDQHKKEVEMYEIDLMKELSVTIVESEVELISEPSCLKNKS